MYCCGVCALDCPVGSFQPPPDPTLNKAALARLQAEENSRRLVRIANETLKYGSILVAVLCSNVPLLEPASLNLYREPNVAHLRTAVKIRCCPNVLASW